MGVRVVESFEMLGELKGGVYLSAFSLDIDKPSNSLT